MIEYRFARADEYRAYLDFANIVFAQATGHKDFDFAALIPKVYAPDADMAHIHCLAHDSERGLVGLVAALPCDMHVQDRVLHTGYIGTVSVHPEARGEGHMIRLMNMQLDKLRADGCDLVFLGGLRQRYEYFGYVPGGMRWEMHVSRANIRHALRDVPSDDITFIPLQPGSVLEAKAEAMYEESAVWFDRRKHFALTCLSYSSRAYACLADGRMLGMIVTNQDGTVIREQLCQQPGDLDRMLKAWMQQNDLSSLSLEAADWQQPLLRHLTGWVEEVSLHSSEQVRILRYRPVLEAMLSLKASYTRLEDGVMAFDAEGQRFTICVRDQKASVTEGAVDPITLDCLSAGRLFTAPYRIEGLPETPYGWFPLPLYVAEPDKF